MASANQRAQNLRGHKMYVVHVKLSVVDLVLLKKNRINILQWTNIQPNGSKAIETEISSGSDEQIFPYLIFF